MQLVKSQWDVPLILINARCDEALSTALKDQGKRDKKADLAFRSTSIALDENVYIRPSADFHREHAVQRLTRLLVSGAPHSKQRALDTSITTTDNPLSVFNRYLLTYFVIILRLVVRAPYYGF
jgi:hypothetical protein